MRNSTHKLLHLSRQDIILALLILARLSWSFMNMYIGICQILTVSKFALKSELGDSANKLHF